MTENRISISFNPNDITEIMAAMKTLQEKLASKLIALDIPDKAALAKIKDKTIPFMEKIIQYLQTNPEFVPLFVDAEEIKKDYDAFVVLNNFLKPLAQITSNLDDTAVLCGSEAYTAGLAYYNAVKQAAKMNVPNAKPIYDDLSVRFVAQKATKKKV